VKEISLVLEAPKMGGKPFFVGRPHPSTDLNDFAEEF
jgi:hypothetical protein